MSKDSAGQNPPEGHPRRGPLAGPVPHPCRAGPGGFGRENQGADIVVADINGSGRPDLLGFHMDNPGGENHGHSRTVWDL